MCPSELAPPTQMLPSKPEQRRRRPSRRGQKRKLLSKQGRKPRLLSKLGRRQRLLSELALHPWRLSRGRACPSRAHPQNDSVSALCKARVSHCKRALRKLHRMSPAKASTMLTPLLAGTATEAPASVVTSHVIPPANALGQHYAARRCKRAPQSAHLPAWQNLQCAQRVCRPQCARGVARRRPRRQRQRRFSAARSARACKSSPPPKTRASWA